MRPAQLRLAAVAGVLAVAVGVATALVVGRDGSSPLQSAAAADPTTTMAVVTDGDHPTPTTPSTRPKPSPPVDRDQQAARAAAVAFLRELGMRNPVAATYRRTGAATAEVGLHPRAGEGGTRFDRVTTVVRLYRSGGGWVATGARAVGTIEVDEPLAFQRIESPLTVSGRSVAYEGTVHVTVTEDRRGPDRVLGRGVVQGGGSELAPFRGQVQFADHTVGVTAGWVVFSGDTGADVGIVSATAVRVGFIDSDHAPQILGVTTDPAPWASAKLVALRGTGTLTVRVRAFGADEVRVLLVPGGTGNRSNARLLGVDTRGEDGERWSVSWHYPDQPVNGHLLIQVDGRGGTAQDESIAIEHL
jgi:hypothetical protein